MLAVVAVYARTTGHALVWDDPLLLGSLWPLPEGVGCLDAVLRPLVFSPSYFRPLGTATLLVELELSGGPDPALHHGVNVALHALSTLLIGVLALRVTRGRTVIAALAAAAYGLHPALVEGVAFVSSRFDLLVTALTLGALAADTHVARPIPRAVCVGALFLGAACAKEMAAAFVVVLPLWHVAAARAEDGAASMRDVMRAHRATYAAVAAAGLLYLVARAASLPHLLPQPEDAQIAAGSPLQHGLLVARSVGTYAVLLVWPFGHVSPLHTSPLPVPASDVRAWTSVVLLMALAAMFVARRGRLGTAAVLGLAALSALLPVVNLRPLTLGGGAFVAERFLLLPLALAALALAAFVRSRAALAAGVLWTAGAAVATLVIVPKWESPRELWAWAMGRAPESALPLINLSLAETNAGNLAAGEALGRRAVERAPERSEAHLNHGLALYRLGRYAEAQDAFLAALRINDENPLLWSNLGRSLLELDRPAEAERVLLERALPLDPGHPLTHQNLAEVYWRVGRLDLAEQHLRTALPRMPPDLAAWAEQRLREIAAARRGR